MIPLSVGAIATIVGGTVSGDADVIVSAPLVLDGRQADPGGMLVAFSGEHVDGHDFAEQAGAAGAVAVLGSRATALPTVIVEDAAAALQHLARHVVQQLRPRLTVIGITGSQGKTSTKDLLAAVLGSVDSTVATLGNLNNELGAPITMLRATVETRFLVVEMGARHLGDIELLTSIAPLDVAIVLNVGLAHIGEFGSQDAIATAKSELVRGLVAGGTAVLNADDWRVAGMGALTDGPVVTFGRTAHAEVRVAGVVLDRLGRASFELTTSRDTHRVTLPVIGAHQAFNAAAVAAAALAVGVPLDVTASALATASVSKWRMEVSELAVGATLLNDSYNSSPGSARSSLDTLAAVDATRRIAVLGQILELGDSSDAEHRAVGDYAAARADVVVAVAAPALAEGARGIDLADNAAAVDWLRANLRAGDVVLVKASRGAHLDEVAAAIGAL